MLHLIVVNSTSHTDLADMFSAVLACPELSRVCLMEVGRTVSEEVSQLPLSLLGAVRFVAKIST